MTDSALIYQYGCAVILDQNHLLTAAHVWEENEFWWETDLAEKRDLYTTIKCKQGKDHLHSSQLKYELILTGIDLENYLAQDDQDDKERQFIRHQSDWAVIKTDNPNWEANNAAIIHKPAADPLWRVPDKTELFLVGYSPIFSEISLHKMVMEQEAGELNVMDGEGSQPSKYSTYIKRGPYTLLGESGNLEREGIASACGVKYPADYPTPGGHSGGGVYLWNKQSEQLELVGLFNTSLSGGPIQITEKNFAGSFLGIPYDFSFTSEERISVLTYAPIGPILESWKRLTKNE